MYVHAQKFGIDILLLWFIFSNKNQSQIIFFSQSFLIKWQHEYIESKIIDDSVLLARKRKKRQEPKRYIQQTICKAETDSHACAHFNCGERSE